MKSLQTILILIILTFSIPAFTQTASEAYRFSISDPLGTARNLGTGNSMFAIGPDFSAIGSNPSGLGGFWKSEFVVTGGAYFNHYSSGFSNDRSLVTENNQNYATFPNVGFILASRPRNSKWISSNWSFGLNRVAEYRRDLNYSGSTLGSMTDAWSENAFGRTPDQLNGFEEGLAYSSGAIYDFEEDNQYETDYQLNPAYRLFKLENGSLEGGKTELLFGYGANYDNKLMIGLTFNIPIVNSTEYRDYQEEDGIANGIPFFNALRYTSFINSTGSGVNGKFGITYKPTKNFNIAFAAHTPTKFFMTDNFSTTVTYDYTDQNNDGPIFSESPYGSFQYAIVTPWSLQGGVGVVIGNEGFIGASAKWTDFSAMHYDYSVHGNGYYYDQEERDVNEDIKRNYASAFDINVGGEMVLSNIRIRGGASLAQSPYSNDNSFDPAYHAGLGYRHDAYYIDIGYKWSTRDEGYLPYETDEAPESLVLTEQIRHAISATVGFKF